MRIGNVYYELDKSEYVYKYRRFTFTFSSKPYIEKFKRMLNDYVNIENKKLEAKYLIHLESDEYFALSLYKKIEKRGFRVKFNDKYIDKNESFKISLSLLNRI